jgi:hypothetical protein
MKLDSLYDKFLDENGHVDPTKLGAPHVDGVKGSTLEDTYDVHPSLLPEELKRLHDKMKTEDQQSFRRTYAVLFEEKATDGLFWVVPDGKGAWRTIFFSRNHFSLYQEHKALWRAHAGRLVATSFGKEPTDEFLELYNAYPRGRLVSIPNEFNKWWIGFGKDYPAGWNETKLMSSLGVGTANSSFEYGSHWTANTQSRKIADDFLGI